MSLEDIEKWVSLLPPANTQIPRTLKVTMAFYYELQMSAHKQEYSFRSGIVSRYDSVQVVINEDQDVPWIMYDQNGEEMKRAES